MPGLNKIAVLGALLVALATLVIWWSINRVFRALRDSALEVAARTPIDLGDVSLQGVPWPARRCTAAGWDCRSCGASPTAIRPASRSMRVKRDKGWR